MLWAPPCSRHSSLCVDLETIQPVHYLCWWPGPWEQAAELCNPLAVYTWLSVTAHIQSSPPPEIWRLQMGWAQSDNFSEGKNEQWYRIRKKSWGWESERQQECLFTSTMFMKCNKNSWASCCRLVENSGWPRPTRALNICGAMPIWSPCKQTNKALIRQWWEVIIGRPHH